MPASQIALVMLLGVLLAPLLVWLALGEMPAITTLTGDGAVLGRR